VTRMFTYRPRDLNQVQVAVSRAEVSPDGSAVGEVIEPEPKAQVAEASLETALSPAQVSDKSAEIERSGKKRKRHRR